MLRKIRCRHSTRSPAASSASSARPETGGRGPVLGGCSSGGGRSQLSSALETANEAASMPNGTGGAIANSRPPVIGPPSSFMTISTPIMRPFTSGSASRPTTWGISVWDELRKNVSHVPITREQADGMGDDKHGEAREQDGPERVDARHRAAPVGAVDEHSGGPAEQQVRQGQRRSDARDEPRVPGQREGQQRSGGQRGAVPGAGHGARAPQLREFPPRRPADRYSRQPAADRPAPPGRGG